MVAAAIRTSFANRMPPTSANSSTSSLACSARQLPKIEAMLREAADEVTAFADLPG
jgi:hypothetical protein